MTPIIIVFENKYISADDIGRIRHRRIPDGDATTAQFNLPSALAMDKQANMYVADNVDYHIRKITPAGIVSTVAGSGMIGYEDGSATVAKFTNVNDMVVDSKGNLYITDYNRIRKVSNTEKFQQ